MPDRPLTPGEALALAKTVADLYADAAARLLEVVATALARGLGQPEWARARLGEVLQLRQTSQRVVATLQRDSSARVLSVLEQSYRAGRLTKPVTSGMVATNQRAVLAYAAELNRVHAAAHTRILRSTEDMYRQAIAEATSPAVTGVVTQRAALARAMDRFAAAGITGFVDDRGRRWQLDSYVDMATRTALGQTFLQGTLDRFAATGRDLVIVSNSPEECPLCRPFEGKVLSISGTARPPQVPEMLWRGSLAAARAAGLFHPNCTHSLGAHIPGLTRPIRDTENPDGYEARQRQRELERRVRESKRRVTALKPLGDTVGLRQQRDLLARRRQDLNEFNTDAGRKAWVSAQRIRIRGLEADQPIRLADLIHPNLPPIERRAIYERAVRNRLDGSYAGLDVQVDAVRHRPDSVYTTFSVLDAGAIVGSIEREWLRDPDGTLWAEHHFMRLAPEVQGRGFATEFNNHLYDWYRESGFDRVELDANIDIGGYAWAQAGYTFVDETAARHVLTRLAFEHVDDGEDAAAVAAILEAAANHPFGHPDFPDAYTVSQAGRMPGRSTWPGKRAMLGSTWRGRRKLGPPAD